MQILLLHLWVLIFLRVYPAAFKSIPYTTLCSEYTAHTSDTTTSKPFPFLLASQSFLSDCTGARIRRAGFLHRAALQVWPTTPLWRSPTHFLCYCCFSSHLFSVSSSFTVRCFCSSCSWSSEIRSFSDPSCCNRSILFSCCSRINISLN